MELAVVKAQNAFSVLHRIASYQYNISYNNQQTWANWIRMEIQWVRETKEDGHLIPNQLPGPVFWSLPKPSVVSICSSPILHRTFYWLHIQLMQASLRDTWQHCGHECQVTQGDTGKRREERTWEDWIWNGDIQNKWIDLKPWCDECMPTPSRSLAKCQHPYLGSWCRLMPICVCVAIPFVSLLYYIFA